MTTKSYDAALDFMPEAKAAKGNPRSVSLLRTLIEAFEEGRAAEADYRALVARGVPHAQAARRVLEASYKG
jgi:hypothetical protein